jgi:carboxyl-terminal processing protease
MSFTKKIIIAVLVGFFILGVFSAGLFIGASTNPLLKSIFTVGQSQILGKDSRPPYLLQDVNYDLYWDVWNTIKEKYYDSSKILDTELFYGSLAGLVASLGDPYSVFLNPQVNNEFTQELSGKFEGIGAEIGLRKDQLTIIAPLPETPADKAGLKSGDKILAIDGLDTQGMALDKAVNLIRGEKGTKVKLFITPFDGNESKEVEIVRDTIKIISVSWEDKGNQVVYIKISYFNQDTFDRFSDAVNEALATNPKTIILDLRGNPGGFLDVAVKIASYWVEDKPVVLEKIHDGTVTPFPSVGRPILKDLKTYVLVNEGSASASEILAGALQDYKLGTIVGQQSFGKGSVQDLIDFNDGSSVKLTIAKWLTPNGQTIDEVGITPDVVVEMTPEDYDENRDPQFDKVMQLITEQ